MGKLTHFNRLGEAHMVDVGDKEATHRIAVADGIIRMQAETLQLIESGWLTYSVSMILRKFDTVWILRAKLLQQKRNTGIQLLKCFQTD